MSITAQFSAAFPHLDLSKVEYVHGSSYAERFAEFALYHKARKDENRHRGVWRKIERCFELACDSEKVFDCTIAKPADEACQDDFQINVWADGGTNEFVVCTNFRFEESEYGHTTLSKPGVLYRSYTEQDAHDLIEALSNADQLPRSVRMTLFRGLGC